MLNSNGKIISYILSLAFISTPHLCTQLCTFFQMKTLYYLVMTLERSLQNKKNMNLIILYNNYLVCSCNWAAGNFVKYGVQHCLFQPRLKIL